MLKLILFEGGEFVTIVGRSSDIGGEFPYSISLNNEILKNPRKFKTSGEYTKSWSIIWEDELICLEKIASLLSNPEPNKSRILINYIRESKINDLN